MGRNGPIYRCERDALPTELYPHPFADERLIIGVDNLSNPLFQLLYPAHSQGRIGLTESKTGAFGKVEECLYRYLSNGV